MINIRVLRCEVPSGGIKLHIYIYIYIYKNTNCNRARTQDKETTTSGGIKGQTAIGPGLKTKKLLLLTWDNITKYQQSVKQFTEL